jgi:POT family proton-dependent oligopeptide transporter
MQNTNKHPIALRYLFTTELWERFSYWSVQSLIVLYMTQKLGFNDDDAYLLYGAFASLLMATPIFGGYIADRHLGSVHTVSLGAIYLVIGYALLSYPTAWSFTSGMAILIIGNGLLKPNISSLLGSCYHEQHPLRQSGYTLFYLGINTGTITGIIACGFIAKWVSFTAAFALAAVAIFIGFCVFTIGKKQVRFDRQQAQNPSPTPTRLNLRLTFIILSSIAVISGLYFALRHPDLANSILITIGACLTLYLVVACISTDKKQRGPFIISLLLTLFSIGFWALYMQMPMSMTLFVARDVNLNVFGLNIPPSTVTAFNGLLILILAPFCIRLWKKLAQAKCEPSFAGKFALACACIGIGFLILAYGAHLVDKTHLAPLWTVFAGYIGLTLGELFLSPVGLAMISLYTPEKFRSFMMGTWFFALAASTAIASQLAKLAAVPDTLQDGAMTAQIYQTAFIKYAGICFATGLVITLCLPLFKKLSPARSA